MGNQIHPTAIVDPKAELGSEVEVGPYSIIGPDVVLGDRCRIRSHVVVEGCTTLGPENEIFQFASVGAAPQDLKYHGERSTLTIGARNTIREYVTLQPGTEHGGMATTIGDNNLFMASSHVGHDCRVGSNNVFANCAALGGHVVIEDNVILGGLSAIHQFCRVGTLALVTGGAATASDIPPFCIGEGNRCKLRAPNLIGMQRAGFSEERVSKVKRAFRHFFSDAGGLQEKVKNLPPELKDDPAVSQMATFIAASERGVCLPYKS